MHLLVVFRVSSTHYIGRYIIIELVCWWRLSCDFCTAQCEFEESSRTGNRGLPLMWPVRPFSAYTITHKANPYHIMESMSVVSAVISWLTTPKHIVLSILGASWFSTQLAYTSLILFVVQGSSCTRSL